MKMRKLLLLIVALLAGASGAWADVTPTAVVGTDAFQATTLTAGASGHTITKDGSGNVTISPNNSGAFGATSGRFTCTLVVKINVPSTTTAGILCDLRPASDNVQAAQGLYMNTDCKLQTSWGYNGSITPRTAGSTLTTGEHTIIFTTGESGATVYVDGVSKLTDSDLKASGVSYKAIYIPSTYASFVTEVYFFSSIQNTTNISSIVTECSNRMHVSQQGAVTVNVPSGKTIVIDNDELLSRFSFAGDKSIDVASGKTLTLDVDGSSISSLSGGGTALQKSNITTTVTGDLPAITLKATNGTLKYTGKTNAEPTLNGTTLYGVTLAGPNRIKATGNITIENLVGNDQSTAANTYAFYTNTNVSVTLKGNCDFTKKSDGTDATAQYIGVNSGGTLTIADNANVKVKNLYNSTTVANNANITIGSGATLEATGSCYSPYVTNNGTLTMGSTLTTNELTLNEGSTINISGSNLSGATTVSGDATLNATADLTLNKAITVASDKTLTIDGANNTVVLTGVVTNNGTINFKNATLTANLNDRSLNNYTFTSCTATAQFTETTDEYKAGGFTITNIPTGVTVKVKKYGATDYETVTPDAGTVTISHSVGVSGLAAWLDYTFNESTKATNTTANPNNTIPNAGNAGSGNNLTIDTNYNKDNSYNDDGTLKVMSTPYRNITWPTNYTVAVAGNVPDVENGCLVAFGSVNGTGHYLAIIRGASQNEIKLVKGHQINNAFEVISTMSAANATALSHLVVFTKQGDSFDVYLDGVNVAHTTYSETLGGGFQIGSIHGGVTGTGVVRVANMDAAIKEAVFAKAIRVYDYVISEDQMEQLKEEFPYVSYGGKYSRTISGNSNLSATDAWLNNGTQGYVDVPVNATVDAVTYYPDVEITTTAASTLTVNANMDADNIKFEGAGKLTIASDGTHNINIFGSVTANGPVSVKYGETDLSAVPVTIGESGSVEFDFSGSDFSSVYDATEYPVTGNTSDYGSKVTGVNYPSDAANHTYTLAFNGTNNRYILTVAPTVALKKQQALDIASPYKSHIGAGLGKYTITLGETAYTDYDVFETAVTSWDDVTDYDEPIVTINQPTTNKFYRFNIGSNYMCNVAGGDNVRTITTTNNDKSTIFYLNSSNYLIAYADGFGFNWAYCKAATGIFNAFEFSEASTFGKYLIHALNGTGSASDRYLAIDEENSKLNAGQGEWTLTEVLSLPVTISSIGLSSFYSPVDVVVPEGVTAYTGTISGSGDYLILTSIETGQKIKANTGVILEGTANATVDFEITSDASDPSDNDLSGTVATKAKTKGDLVLGDKNGKAGFYTYSGENLAGFKSYISADKLDADIKGLTFSFMETVIQALQEAGKSNIIYDLNGRRVQKAQKGIYIIDGKKVIIR